MYDKIHYKLKKKKKKKEKETRSIKNNLWLIMYKNVKIFSLMLTCHAQRKIAKGGILQ